MKLNAVDGVYISREIQNDNITNILVLVFGFF